MSKAFESIKAGLVEAFQDVNAANLTALKAEIGQGTADIEAGRIKQVDVESIKRRGRAAQSRTNAIWSTRNRPRL